MTPKKPTATPSRPKTDLTSMYRAIGISAVAAALHFQGEARHADAPPTAPDAPAAFADERFHEAA